MARIGAKLRRLRLHEDEFKSLSRACSDSPVRQLSIAKAVAAARRSLVDSLQLDCDPKAHHPASPWRYDLTKQVQILVADPDVPVAEWLREGAPMRLNVEITPGGQVPPAEDMPELAIAELSALDMWTHTLPSFEATFHDGPPPGVGLVAGCVNAGFGELFGSEHEARLHFGAAPRPSPLCRNTKEKGDSTAKHRIIQDMRRSSVNGAVRLSER